MSKPEVLEKKSINLPLLKKELERIKERDEELSFRAGRTEEYVNEFAQISAEEAEELKKELEDLDIARLKEEMIHKIIDIMPSTEEELEVVLKGYTVSVQSENIEKVFEVVENYLPE